jgi:hypothetical protein
VGFGAALCEELISQPLKHSADTGGNWAWSFGHLPLRHRRFQAR